jgi:hypothetical protein
MNAITLLEGDHRRFQDMLKRLDGTSERAVKTREELFTSLKRELLIHEEIEEEIFYAALKEHPRARDIVLEGYEEHHVVDTILGELSALPYDSETWTAKFTVMRENLEHHIEEEEDDMFKKADRVFDKAELGALGDRMVERQAFLRPHPRDTHEAAVRR